ncbi:MAG: hypothetical protein IKU44_01125 [Firmicutes bacterium]|nr:hypothetical protein [Bacillota bacterium]
MTTFETFIAEAKNIENGYVVASLTDAYIVDFWPMEKDSLDGKEGKILEVRVFNEEKEIKMFRTDISKEFRMRIREDAGETETEYFDEEQLLDIDTKKSAKSFAEEHMVYATGGGRYFLPLADMKGAAVKIRYYLDSYKESGQARICDWRLVTFKEGK